MINDQGEHKAEEVLLHHIILDRCLFQVYLLVEILECLLKTLAALYMYLTRFVEKIILALKSQIPLNKG